MMRKTGTREWAEVNKNIFQHGCKHNCRYCFARANALRFGRIKNPSEWKNMDLDWNRINEIPKFYSGRIMFPSAHDILPEYIEETIGYLAGWLKCDNEILIVSKPHIECITAICDRLASFKGKIVFRFTIGSSSDEILKFWEPGAPSFQERFNSLIYAFEHGFKTSVSCEPFLDDNIIGLVEALLPYINDTIWIGKMNHIRERVDTRGWTENDWKFLKLVENSQTDENIRQIYEHFKNNPKIKWKDSVKKVMHLPEEGIG